MTAPEIPDEHWNAAYVAAERARTTTAPGTDPMSAVLTAAWPHLYAAALRHAADRLDDEVWDGSWAGERIRRMADEVAA